MDASRGEGGGDNIGFEYVGGAAGSRAVVRTPRQFSCLGPSGEAGRRSGRRICTDGL